MNVFLTGGTGLLGSHIAERLRARGHEVTALVRPTSRTDHLEALGCVCVVGDVLDPVVEQVPRIRGADAVIHTAALVFRAGARADYLRVNVDGTGRLLEACGRVAPRFLLLSSVAVYAGLLMDRPLVEPRWTEADPARQSPYAESKHRSERSAWRAHERGEIRLTTFRPCVVYGERDRHATGVITRWASRPVVPLVGGGRTRVPVVYAGNVARGVVAGLERETSVGRAYNLALDTPITTRELVRRVGEELGRTPRILPIPTTPLQLAADALDALARRAPGVEPPGLARAVRSLSHDNPYESTRARLELGWSGLTPHPVALRRTLAWWRSTHD